VDLPGCVPEDIEVNIDRGFLELKAERKQVHRENDGFNRRIERSYGKVSRRIELPIQADQNKAECTFKNGVLTVSFKKVAGATPLRRQLLIK
jgi:HSP20 family protein